MRKDKVVTREKIREIDKAMGEHSTAWCSIWGTATNHEHEDRVINSKVSKSENAAQLYLAHKDHKEGDTKTRPGALQTWYQTCLNQWQTAKQI